MSHIAHLGHETLLFPRVVAYTKTSPSCNARRTLPVEYPGSMAKSKSGLFQPVHGGYLKYISQFHCCIKLVKRFSLGVEDEKHL